MNKKASVDPFEWSFNDIKADEIDACFHYEYAREILELKTGILEWRKKVPDLHRIIHDYTFTEGMKQLEALIDGLEAQGVIKSVEEILKIKSFPKIPDIPSELSDAINSAFPFYQSYVKARLLAPESIWKTQSSPMVGLIAAFPEYPQKPWLSIKNKTRKKQWGKFWKAPSNEDVRDEPTRCLVDVTNNIHEWETNTYEGKKYTVSEMIERILKDPKNTQIKAAYHLIHFSWNYPNDQIVEAFRVWITANRPKEYPEPPKPYGQLGYGWHTLQKRKTTLLEDLGYLRRRRECKDWAEFLKNWPQSRKLTGHAKAAQEKRAHFEKRGYSQKAIENLEKADAKDARAEKIKSPDVFRFLEQKCKTALEQIAALERVVLGN